MKTFITSFLLSVALSAFAVTLPELPNPSYYVSTTGDNTADGSFEAPFKTLEYAVNFIDSSESKQGTIYLMPGTHSLTTFANN